MKKILSSLMAAGLAGMLASAGAQPAQPGDTAPAAPDQAAPPADTGGNAPDAANTAPAAAPDATAQMAPGADPAAGAEAATAATPAGPRDPMVITPSKLSGRTMVEFSSQFAPPEQRGTNSLDDLTLNFNRAPLEMVLNYLSDAAGFIIVQDTRIRGTVTVNGKHLTRDEAVNLLNAVLNKNGYAAIREERTLTIVDKTEAKTREIPVKSGNIPSQIPRNAEIVTQIIPIRFVEARQLVSDLSSFVSPQATVVANEAGNSIVITDTQANIHHLAEIIKAIDDSAEAETEIRVFHLEHANPNDVATEIANVFPSSTSGGAAQSPIRFGGGPGGRGGGGPAAFMQAMMGGGAGNSANDRIKKATQVNAVADARISSVIVTAPRDLMDQIASMMKDLDVASDRDQDVFVFKLNNADSQQAAQVLQNMFQSSSSRNTTGNNQNSALQQRIQTANQNMGSSSSSSSFGGSSLGGGGGGRSTGGF
jgi:type II secretory pathway component GspD/PulD (secretin)